MWVHLEYQINLKSTSAHKQGDSSKTLLYNFRDVRFTFETVAATSSVTEGIVVPIEAPTPISGAHQLISDGTSFTVPMNLGMEVDIQIVDQATSAVVYTETVVSAGSSLNYAFNQDLDPGKTYQLIEDYKGLFQA